MPSTIHYLLTIAETRWRVKIVYIVKKNGKAIHHISLEAMRQAADIEHYELEMTETVGGFVSVINNKIVVGKTEIEAKLTTIDVRSARSVVLADGKTPEQFDIEKLDALEAEAKGLRAELQELS